MNRWQEGRENRESEMEGLVVGILCAGIGRYDSRARMPPAEQS